MHLGLADQLWLISHHQAVRFDRTDLFCRTSRVVVMNVDRSCRSIKSSSNGNPLASLRWLLPTSRFISVHVVLATVAIATMSAVCSADTHDGSGESYATAIQDRARLAAEVEVLKAEQTVLLSEDRSAGPALLQDLTRMDSVQLRERLTGLLDANFTSVPHALTGAVGSAASIIEELSRDLSQARTRLVADEKYTFQAAATAVGVSHNSLRDWHAKFAPQPVPCDEHASLNELREENQRLRQQLKRAEMEREILKKAAAYFAKESL